VSTTVKRSRGDGQALVEFAMAVIPFLILLMGVIVFCLFIIFSAACSAALRAIRRAIQRRRWRS